jgi:uncharacterized protein
VNSINPCILIFLKAPNPGQVKTRLGKSIGDAHATQLYRCFTEDILTTVDLLDIPTILCFSPLNGLSILQDWLGLHRTYLPQQGKDLGDRMANAFRASFAMGYQQVLVLGTDSPDLPGSYLLDALAALQDNKVAIGPSEDGGYYTLSFTPTNFCPAVFNEMPWSTDQVYPLTLRTLRQHTCDLEILPTWSDIDTLDDLWQFYQRHLGDHTFTRSLDYLRAHTDVLFQYYPA